MRKGLAWTWLIASASAPMTAQAGTRETLQPVQIGDESVRFDRGDYVLDLVGQRAAVQVRSVPSDGGVSFIVSILNTGAQSINVNVSDIRFDGTKEPVRVLTRAEMVQKVEHRAGWAKFLTLATGSLAAAVQANQRDYYHATTTTPYGTYTTQISAPCYGCQAAANETVLRNSARVAHIQTALDDARSSIGEQAFQFTTIYPGQLYGGRIVLSRFKHELMSQMRLIVTVGGESFQFGFRFAPDGTPTPTYRMTAVSQLAPMPASARAYSSTPPPVMAYYTVQAHSVGQASDHTVRLVANSVSATGKAVQSSSTLAAVNGFTADKWHRCYSTLIESGISNSEAKQMANEEFGSID